MRRDRIHTRWPSLNLKGADCWRKWIHRRKKLRKRVEIENSTPIRLQISIRLWSILGDFRENNNLLGFLTIQQFFAFFTFKKKPTNSVVFWTILFSIPRKNNSLCISRSSYCYRIKIVCGHKNMNINKLSCDSQSVMWAQKCTQSHLFASLIFKNKSHFSSE